MAIKFLPFTCEKCAGNAFVDPPVNGIYKCAYCGTYHVLVDDSLKKTEENKRSSFFGAADGFMEMKKYHYAEKSFQKILDEWPSQSRAWWGLVICYSERFTRIQISEKEYDTILDCAENALQFASPEEYEILNKQWTIYSSKVISYFENQKSIREAELKRKEEREAFEKRKKQAQEAAEAQILANERAKKEELDKYKKEKRRELNQKENRIKGTMLSVSISIFILSNLIYGIVVFSLNIPNSIYYSPACIAPVIVGGLVTMAFSGVSCGIFNAPPLGGTPAVINAISVILMIAGMLSHSSRFFDNVFVIICFGAVGMGVTALIGWLGSLIATSIAKDGNATDYASKKCNQEYNSCVDKKRKELGL